MIKKFGKMTQTKHLFIFSILLGLLLIVGCTGKDQDVGNGENNKGVSKSAQADETSNAKDVVEEEDVSEEEQGKDLKEGSQTKASEEEPAVEEDETGNDDTNLPDEIKVNKQGSHPNGVVVSVESISFDEEYITVNITAINGHDYTVELANTTFGSATLEDNQGFQYHYLGPEDNETLEIKSGERMSGSLIFIGQLQENAVWLNFALNPKGEEKNEFFKYPKFTFDGIEVKDQ